MTKKFFCGMIIIALFSLLFAACNDNSSGVVQTAPSLKGAFVLYESAQAGGSDYCYIDFGKDSVFNNLYQNSNGGNALAYTPGGIKLPDNQNLYIVCGGQVNNGKIYKINSSNNQTVISQTFGSVPKNFDIDDSKIYVSSSGGSYVTEFDLNLNFETGLITVSRQPGRIMFTTSRFIVCRQPYSPDNILDFIIENNNLVVNINLPFVPLALIDNTSGYFLTAFGSKNVYKLDSTTLVPNDSIAIPTTGHSVGNIIKEGQLKSLVVVDSTEVWEINHYSIPPSTKLLIPFPGGNFKITDIAYEDVNGRIYIADNQGGPPYLGIVHVYDPVTGFEIKNYSLGGRNPVGFAFKY